MAGFGSFMEGFQGGAKSMSDLRKARQTEKLYDRAIEDYDEKILLEDEERAKVGGRPRTRVRSKDPWILRVADYFSDKTFSQDKNLPQPAPVSDVAIAGEQAIPEVPEEEGFGGDVFQMADGGRIRDGGRYADGTPMAIPRGNYFELRELQDQRALAELQRARAQGAAAKDYGTPKGRTTSNKAAPSAEPRTAINTRAGVAAEKVTGYADKARIAAEESTPGRMLRGTNIAPAPEGAGFMRRGANWARRGLSQGALPKLGAAGLGAAAAWRGFNTDTEQYRERFGLETNDPSFAGDLGVRTLGLASDLGDLITGGEAGKFYRDKQNVGNGKPAPPNDISNPELQPATPESKLLPEAPPRTAVPTAPGGKGYTPRPDPVHDVKLPENIDWSKVNIQELPTMTVRDWKEERADAIKSKVMRGATLADATTAVDEQVIVTQMQGFQHFLTQAEIALFQNDPRGVAAALRMANMYLPSTNDVQIAEYNGQIMIVQVDEETGEPIHAPVPLTKEVLSALRKATATPGQWAQMAQDRRKEDREDYGINQLDRQIDAGALNAESDALRAQAYAQGVAANIQQGQGADGKPLTSGETLRGESSIQEFMGMYGHLLPELADDEQLALEFMAALNDQFQREGGRTSITQLVERYIQKRDAARAKAGQ